MMRSLPFAALLLTGLVAGLTACDAPGAGAVTTGKVTYRGVETRLLDGDLVEFRVAASGQVDTAVVTDYATCAAAQYALIRGYGFARHIRTSVDHSGTVWRANAVYTISAALPEGLRTIDAEVTVRDCKDRGIPTV